MYKTSNLSLFPKVHPLMKNRQTLPCKSLLAASHKFQGRLKQAQRDQPRLLQREYFLAIELLVNYPLSVIEVSAMALHL